MSSPVKIVLNKIFISGELSGDAHNPGACRTRVSVGRDTVIIGETKGEVLLLVRSSARTSGPVTISQFMAGFSIATMVLPDNGYCAVCGLWAELFLNGNCRCVGIIHRRTNITVRVARWKRVYLISSITRQYFLVQGNYRDYNTGKMTERGYYRNET